MCLGFYDSAPDEGHRVGMANVGGDEPPVLLIAQANRFTQRIDRAFVRRLIPILRKSDSLGIPESPAK
jgi:hypothetical protein